MSFRMGYAKSTARNAADGNVGFGFGYTRFRNSKWAFGAHAQLDVLGRYGDAYEIESPWTVEVTRHYKWATAARPYLGLGGGAYYHKVRGTGDDAANLKSGFFLTGGVNAPVSDHGLLGFDLRASLVDTDRQENPVFGSDVGTAERQTNALHWSAKVNYAWMF